VLFSSYLGLLAIGWLNPHLKWAGAGESGHGGAGMAAVELVVAARFLAG